MNVHEKRPKKRNRKIRNREDKKYEIKKETGNQFGLVTKVRKKNSFRDQTARPPYCKIFSFCFVFLQNSITRKAGLARKYEATEMANERIN